MKPRTLHRELWLPRRRDEVFPFFADAANLNLLVPEYLRFGILTPPPIEMRRSTLIDYRLRLRGIPVRWRTLISAWEPPSRFVDEQVRGPYRLWRHEHRFEDRDGGTLCIDHVDYAVPGGVLEPLIHRLLVRRDVEHIFDYRRRRMTTLFPAALPAGAE